MKRYTQKELTARWNGCSLRTVQREVRRWQLKPADFIGIQPVFDEADVIEMESRRRMARAKQFNLPHEPAKILTVKEAKRLAGRGRT